ncbi:MAG: class II aldolase/adducin family protein [Bacillota bacterium]|jgi:L-fuculose-phosphate aldolase|nr:class II aldolase/adducin family protein [Bacillota bacterium]NLD13086.1 class II aldolase/adducin family protein [Bacillota bacterium]HOB89439.1 class II aldolase/adducin family protein [Bacillota bacterium]HOL02724.1 class II aldolase/adducin family protein [Bacillota bacterium]HPO80447.1 class II aldolase/adducin family protein [Bacillota bacterium]
MQYEALRNEVVETARSMLEKGLTVGTGGNVSVRCPDSNRFLITPSSLPYETLVPEDVVVVNLEDASYEGRNVPSIEYHLHRKVYLARPDVSAIVHAHPPVASVLAALRKPLPLIIDACTYAFKDEVKVAEYGKPGTIELAENTVRALGDNTGVIMANHGILCVGENLEEALGRCEVLDKAALTYILSLSIGTPVCLEPLCDQD